MSQRDPVLVSFGQCVRKFREKHELSQEALAERADLDRTYLSDIERGARNPGILNVVRIAKALEIKTSELLEGVDS